MLEDLYNERCDGCGARAKHIAKKSGIYRLAFCNHCHDRHHDALLDSYWLIWSDESPTEPVPVSAYTES